MIDLETALRLALQFVTGVLFGITGVIVHRCICEAIIAWRDRRRLRALNAARQQARSQLAANQAAAHSALARSLAAGAVTPLSMSTYPQASHPVRPQVNTSRLNLSPHQSPSQFARQTAQAIAHQQAQLNQLHAILARPIPSGAVASSLTMAASIAPSWLASSATASPPRSVTPYLVSSDTLARMATELEPAGITRDQVAAMPLEVFIHYLAEGAALDEGNELPDDVIALWDQPAVKALIDETKPVSITRSARCGHRVQATYRNVAHCRSAAVERLVHDRCPRCEHGRGMWRIEARPDLSLSPIGPDDSLALVEHDVVTFEAV